MLATGSQLGPYQIVSSLGAGGMGEVYRARDARLDRDVAVKVLPPIFADDPERRSRFEREARALASLNHPNIAHIYGAEEAQGAVAIVMELVEGEDLATRISRGPLTWREARSIGHQLAEGLDAAHERGIIHRDLKPANIRITPDDTVKILDFGLAKAIAGQDTLSQDPALSPTLTSTGTRLGTIVGTAAYMAPEQAKGKAVDKRADIWAFGVVLFEMLTGRSPFASESTAESIGLVVTKEPDWSTLPPSVPPHVVELLKRCLAKDAKGRLRDIGDAIHVLAQPDVSASERSATTVSRSRRGVILGTAAGIALAIAAAAIAWTLKPSASLPLRQLELPATIAASGDLAISPDGARLAYVSEGRLYVRELSDTEPRDLTPAHPTTSYPIWSTDSSTVGYYVNGTIRTVPASGGPVFTVTRVPGEGQLTGILWHPDGSIVFAAWRDSLYRVPGTGGTPEILLKVNPETEVDFHTVSLGREGRLLIGVHLRRENIIRTELVDLGEGGRRIVLADDSSAGGFRYVPPGLVLFARVGTNQGLWAIPYTETRLDLSKSILVAAGATQYSVSDEGTLVVRSQVPPSFTLEWRAPDGSQTTVPGTPIPDLNRWIALSPRGDRVAYISGQTQPSLFVRDLTTGADTRLATDSAGQNVALGPSFMLRNPAWFSSGDRILYARGPIEQSRLVAQRADGASEATALSAGEFGRISADGQWLLWIEDHRGQGQLRFARLERNSVGEPRTFPGTEKVSVRTFDLSPDGRLLAYSSREADQQLNIHLAEFPDARARWQVTTNGGTLPHFSRDGRELVFASGSPSATGAPEGRLMLMPLTLGPPLKLGVARVLLSGTDAPDGFDTGPDGRLLLARRIQRPQEQDSRAVLVQNWPALLNPSARMGVK